MRASLNTISLEKVLLLRDMWIFRPDVDQEGVANAFKGVLLFQDNINLGYCLGSFKVTST